MLALLAPILSSLFSSAFGSFVEGYKAKLSSENTAEKIAADLAARELAVQQAEVQAQAQLRVAEIGHPWEVDKLFAYVLCTYFGWGLIWCNMLGYGKYVPLTGDLETWAGSIILFIFGKRGIENVVRIIKR